MELPGYKILKKINQGGMATVYLALQESLDRRVALKVMSPVLSADKGFTERFRREANIVGQLSHPNIIAIYDIDEYKKIKYIAMDYLPAGSVTDRIHEGISAQESLDIVRQMALALEHAHDKGFIHRDIKPENILFRANGIPVLSDFGVARAVSSNTQMTNAGTVLGTPNYMSPEQARGKELDGRSDLYSLGVVFYEMLVGHPPYQAEEAVAVAIQHLTAPIPKLPAELSVYQPLINRLLAKKPEDRFQSAREVIDFIDSFNATLAIHKRSSGNAPEISTYDLFKALIATSYAHITSSIKKKIGAGPTVKKLETEISEITPTEVRPHIFGAGGLGVLVYRRINIRLALTIITVVIAAAIVIIWASTGSDSSSQVNAIDTVIDNPKNQITSTENSANSENTQPLDDGIKNSANEPQELAIAPENNPETSVNTAATAGSVEQPTTKPSPQKPTKFSVTVKTQPKDALVRIMNIRERYQDGIKLAPARYLVNVTKSGYFDFQQWYEVTNNNLTIEINLTKKPTAGKIIQHKLADGTNAPEMIVIEPGNFIMGSVSFPDTQPRREVSVDHYFAVSTTEITFEDFDKFTQATHSDFIGDQGWGREKRPVINVTWLQATAYTQWLSKQTQQKYRLITELEWEYIASNYGNQEYPWPGEEEDGREKANCRSGCKSTFSTFLTRKTAPAKTYPPNTLGIFELGGNVAEWTQDCYYPSYDSALNKNTEDCEFHSVRGGSYLDKIDELNVFRRESFPSDQFERDLGFRIVLELPGI